MQQREKRTHTHTQTELASLGGLCETMAIGLHLTSTSPPTCITKEPSGCLTERRKSSSLSLEHSRVEDMCHKEYTRHLYSKPQAQVVYMPVYHPPFPMEPGLHVPIEGATSQPLSHCYSALTFLHPCLFYVHLWVDLPIFYVSCV